MAKSTKKSKPLTLFQTQVLGWISELREENKSLNDAVDDLYLSFDIHKQHHAEKQPAPPVWTPLRSPPPLIPAPWYYRAWAFVRGL